MPVILVTDILVWLLVVAVTSYAFYCRRHPHLAVPWARVFRSAAAMASVVVLVVYVVLGLLDSLHFRPSLEQKAGDQKAYSSDVLSVLDLAVSRLRGRSEMGSRGDTAVQSYRRVRSSEPPGGRRYPVPVRFRPSRRALVALALTSVTASVVAVPVYAQKLPKNLGEYIAEADKLCAASNVKLLAESRKIETESARSTRGGRLKKVDIALPDAVSKFAVAVAVPELEKLSASLRDIPSPRDEEKTIDTLLDQFDAGIAAVKKDPKSAIFSDQLKASSKAFKAMRFGENTKFSACGIHIDRDEDKKK